MEPYVNRNGLFATPQTSDREEPLTDEQLTKYVAKYEAKGIMPSCAYQLRQAAVMNLLPTPTTTDYNTTLSEEAKQECLERRAKEGKTAFPSKLNQLRQMARDGLLPTPTAIEGVKWTNTFNPNSQMGQSLSAMAGSGMLPTPAARDWKGETNPGVVKEGSGCIYGDTLPDTIMREAKKSAEQDGATSRLSPLYTEEMMGFPLMWTTLPFLSQSGETNQ